MGTNRGPYYYQGANRGRRPGRRPLIMVLKDASHANLATLWENDSRITQETMCHNLNVTSLFTQNNHLGCVGNHWDKTLGIIFPQL